MIKVLAHPIAGPNCGAFTGEVLGVESRLGELRVEVAEVGGARRLEVYFAHAEAFRVMDERDLGEYWPTCSTPNGWLFEVTDGGWLAQERERATSLVVLTHKNLREFFIAGEDDCVSVLSLREPEVRTLPESSEV